MATSPVNLDDSKKDSAPVSDALTKAIEDSKAKVADDSKKEEPKEEKKEEVKKEEAKKEEVSGLSEEELEHAKNLFSLLKNKDTATEVVTMLAKQAGLIQTKEEAKIVEKSITDVLKEELGEEYDFMAAKLAPAIEKVVKSLVTKETADIKKQFQSIEEEKISSDVDKGIEALTTEFEDAEIYFKAIYDLMDEVPPHPEATAKNYFKDLYHIAKGRAVSADKNDNKTNERKETKIAKNRSDAAARLASGGKGTTKEGEPIPTKLTIDEAIRKAAEEIEVK